jgi:rhodanese-related sulfurtransferase
MPSYAGDVTPTQAWAALKTDDKATLVDVRTEAEWTFVGIGDLSSLGKKPLLLSWQVYPSMAVNPSFVRQLKDAGMPEDTPLYFLCRSGGRSKAAATAATEAGFRQCFNIVEGFEGDPDGNRHRNRKNGWKFAGLPWVQG